MTRFCWEANPPPDTRTTADQLLDQIKLIRYTLFFAAAEERTDEELFSDGEWVAMIVGRFNTRPEHGEHIVWDNG